MPRALLLSSFELMGVLLHASSSLALVFVEQGAAWWWLLSWLEPTAAVQLDSTLQTAALALINALMQHPQSILALSAQQILPSHGHADDALAALLSYGVLDIGSTRSPLLGPLRRVHRPLVHAIHLKVQLHQQVAAVSAAFGEAQGQHTTPSGDDQMRAQQQLAADMRSLITFMAHSGEHNGEPVLAASLSVAFLQHALQFQLLSVVQFMLSAASSARGIAFGSPLDVLTEFVRPMMMIGFFGAHCSMQHALHVVSEERVSHQLMQSLRQMAAALQSEPAPAAGRDKLDPTPPWRQARALLDWMEGHVQALLLVLHCSGVPVSSLCPSWSVRVRCASWSALCAFVQTHPFGVECTLRVLRQSQSWRSDVDDAGVQPPPGLAFDSLHRLFVRVFEVESAYAPLLHSHAISVLEALMRSTDATPLFFGLHGRLPVALTVGPHCAPDTVSFVTHAITAVGLLQGSHTDLAWEAPLLDALQERALLLGQAPGVSAESLPLLHLVTSLLRCAEGLMHEPSVRRLRGPEAAVTQAGLSLSVASDQFATVRAARGVRNRIASALFLLAETLGDNETTGSGVLVSPIILELLRVCTRAFEADSSADGMPRRLDATSDVSSASPKHLILCMQSAAECLDALLTLLLSGLQYHVHGSTHSRRLPSDPPLPSAPMDAEVEEGELIAATQRVTVPSLMFSLTELHAALWAAHRTLSAHPWAASYGERATVCSAEAGALCARPLGDRLVSLGHLPRLRVLLHACLSHTLFHLLSPSCVTLSSPLLDAEDDRRVLVQSAPLAWWTQLFGVQMRSCWHAHMRFLCDVMPPATRGDGSPRSWSAWQTCQQEHLFRPLFDHLELGPPSLSETLGAISPPRLLSSFLVSDALWAASATDVQADLVELIARIVECASPTVARNIMQACVTRFKQGAANIEASITQMARARQLDRSLPLSSAPVFLSYLRELQLLRSLALSSSRACSLLMDVDVVSALHTLLRLSLPLDPSLRSLHGATPAAAASSSAIPEAIPLQHMAMDIAHTIMDRQDQRTRHGHEAASAMTPLLPTICSLLLHPHAPLAITSGRLLLALCRSRSVCQSLVASWLQFTASVDHLLSVPPSVGRVGSPLLQWLHVRLVSCGLEPPSPSPSPSPVCALPLSLELELWSQVAELMRLISTQGPQVALATKHHQRPTPSGSDPSCVASRSSLSPPPPPDDRWWSACVSSRYPGLPSLCALMQCPVRSTPHAPDSRSVLLQAHAVTAHQPPDTHPLMRIIARLQQIMRDAQGTPSSRSLCVASLLRCFETIRQQMQLANRLHIQCDDSKDESDKDDRHTDTSRLSPEVIVCVRMESCMWSRQPE